MLVNLVRMIMIMFKIWLIAKQTQNYGKQIFNKYNNQDPAPGLDSLASPCRTAPRGWPADWNLFPAAFLRTGLERDGYPGEVDRGVIARPFWWRWRHWSLARTWLHWRPLSVWALKQNVEEFFYLPSGFSSIVCLWKKFDCEGGMQLGAIECSTFDRSQEFRILVDNSWQDKYL